MPSIVSEHRVLNSCSCLCSRTTDLEVTEVRLLTGEEQKALCKLATQTVSNQLGVNTEDARCVIGDQVVTPVEGGRRLADGTQLYTITGVAKLNFDSTIPPEVASPKQIKKVMEVAKKKASDKVVKGAIPRTEAPSSSPSMEPTISAAPTTETQAPTKSPITPLGLAFSSVDVGYNAFAGESFESSDGTYNIKASGKDIWGTEDSFHYMYVESSGDLDMVIFIQNFSRDKDEWAKAGVSFFINHTLFRTSS